MSQTKSPIHPSDLRGFSRLAFDATSGITHMVQAMHNNIAGNPGETGGVTGLIYTSIRAVTALVGSGVDLMLTPLALLMGETHSPPGREAVIAALNGLMGDHLMETHNPLAISMNLRRQGRPLVLKREALAAAIPGLTGKLVVLVHGLCMNDLEWTRKDHDHGAALARDLGYTPLYLHYNSGLHISSNGRALSRLLETLVEQWPVPVEELVLIGHSMGGLVVRSACHSGDEAGHKWRRQLRKAFFLSTPHHGAPLARGDNWVTKVLSISPYAAPLATLGKARSCGITDLRYANLLDDDWAGLDRFGAPANLPRPVPLPAGVQCYAIAATNAKTKGLVTDVIGDGLVPVNSALGRHQEPRRNLAFSESRQWVCYDANHFDLLSRPDVYQQIEQWLR